MKVCLDCGTENMFSEANCHKCGANLAEQDICLSYRPRINHGISKFLATHKVPALTKLFILIGCLILAGTVVYGYTLIINYAFKLGLTITLAGIIIASLFWVLAQVHRDLKEIKEVVVYLANEGESRKEH